MAEIQEFCLKWNNYQSNLASAFLDLKRGEDFVDVTLACDGRSVQAHRVVLSACSSFFRDLLKATPCKHPIVVLKDVSFGDLVALLEFMYQGEVKVVQDGLSSFLRTAEVLKIKGLTEDSSNQKRPRQDSENANSPSYRGKSWLKTDRQGPTPPPVLAQHSFTGLPPPSMSIVPQPQSVSSNDSTGPEKHLRLSSSIAVTKKSRLIPEHGDNVNQPSSTPSPSWQPERESSVISHNPNHYNPITVRSKAEMIELETSSGSECVEKEEDDDKNHPVPLLDTQMSASMNERMEDPFRMMPSGSQPEIHESMELGSVPGVPLNRIHESHMSHMLGPFQCSVDPLATGIRDAAANGYAGDSGESGGGGGGTVVDAPIPHLSNMDMVLAAGGVGGCGASRFSHRKQPFSLPPLSLPGVSFLNGDVLEPSVNFHSRAADLSPLPIDNPATPFQCPICRRYYTSYASVKRHIRDSHPLTDEVYPCNICGRSYGSRNSLATHRSTKHRDCTRKHKTMEWPGHMGSLEIADSLELGPAKLEEEDIDLDRAYPSDMVFGGQNGAQNPM